MSWAEKSRDAVTKRTIGNEVAAIVGHFVGLALQAFTTVVDTGKEPQRMAQRVKVSKGMEAEQSKVEMRLQPIGWLLREEGGLQCVSVLWQETKWLR